MTGVPSDDTWRWYSVEQAAALLGISTPTVRRRIKAHEGRTQVWTLRDGSTLPVIPEVVTRPQGISFMVRLPTSLEAGSTEGVPIPTDDGTDHDRVMTPGISAQPPVTDPSATDHDGSVTGGSVDRQASRAVAIGAVGADPTLLALVQAVAEKSELIGDLRSRLERSESDHEASRQELARVTAALELARGEAEVALRVEQDRRLAAEAALVALLSRLDAEDSRRATVASWWRRLLRLG